MSDSTVSVFCSLPPSADTNAWPWTQYVEQYQNKNGVVTKWGPWQYDVRVTFGGIKTHRFKPWHYTSGPNGRGGMYGVIEQRDVWGVCLGIVVLYVARARFAEETTDGK